MYQIPFCNLGLRTTKMREHIIASEMLQVLKAYIRRGSRGGEMGEFSPPHPPPLPTFSDPFLLFFFLSLKY